MTKRVFIAMILVGAVAISMSGCKKKTRAGTGSGPNGTDVLNTTGTGGGELGTERPGGFMGTNTMAGQFDTVLFAFDSAQVDDTERAKVEAAAEFLKSNPTANLVLEGNCDERGSAEYNMSLGERRSLAVRAYLVNLGVDAARIQTKSYGAERPKNPGHDEEAWRVNRRVEFVTVQP
jgi:peptidoglycan-associated lipoprotein